VAAPHQDVPGQIAKCPCRNTFALAAALAVKSGNNKIINRPKDRLDKEAHATNGLSMPCHEQSIGPATVKDTVGLLTNILDILLVYDSKIFAISCSYALFLFFLFLCFFFLVLCLPRQVRTSNGAIHHDI